MKESWRIGIAQRMEKSRNSKLLAQRDWLNAIGSTRLAQRDWLNAIGSTTAHEVCRHNFVLYPVRERDTTIIYLLAYLPDG